LFSGLQNKKCDDRIHGSSLVEEFGLKDLLLLLIRSICK